MRIKRTATVRQTRWLTRPYRHGVSDKSRTISAKANSVRNSTVPIPIHRLTAGLLSYRHLNSCGATGEDYTRLGGCRITFPKIGSAGGEFLRRRCKSRKKPGKFGLFHSWFAAMPEYLIWFINTQSRYGIMLTPRKNQRHHTATHPENS